MYQSCVPHLSFAVVNNPTRRSLRVLQVEFSTAGLQLQSVHMAGRGREPPLTTKIPIFAGCLDYVWFSVGDWAVTALLELPYPERSGPDPQAVELGLLPNEVFPSDHLAIGADLRLPGIQVF